MIRYLTVGEILALHRQVVQRTGGAEGIRDLRALQSAVAQPRATFAEQELYPSISEKAAALGFSLIMGCTIAPDSRVVTASAAPVVGCSGSTVLGGMGTQAAHHMQNRAVFNHQVGGFVD